MSQRSLKTKTSHYLDGATAFVRGRKSHKQRELNVLKRAGITKAAIEQVLMDQKPEKALNLYSYGAAADNDPHLRLLPQPVANTLVNPTLVAINVTSTYQSGTGIPWLCVPLTDLIMPQTAAGADLRRCRLGASVELGEFSMRGRIIAGDEIQTPQNVRIMLIRWRGKEPHIGAPGIGGPTLGSILELAEPAEPPHADFQASAPFAYLNTFDGTAAAAAAAGQASVLFDHTVTVSRVSAANADHPEAWFDIKHKLNCKQYYSTEAYASYGGTINPDLRIPLKAKNGLWLVAFSDKDDKGVDANVPQLRCQARLTFVDS